MRPSAPDRAAEGYAVIFARRYLTWNSTEPQSSAHELEPFTGPGLEANAGLDLPSAGEQRVEWAYVVQEREPLPGRHVYTIAAETDAQSVLYLTVGVSRTSGGGLALTGYPAFVGAPTAGPASPLAHLREVEEPALTTVVERALRNYLAGASGDLNADLTPGAQISVPSTALTLESVQRVDWSTAGRSVFVLVRAADPRGVQYTLAYELDVAREQGRWEVAAVQMDPEA